MKCRCPACSRTSDVPNDLLDFLVRCDKCRALFLARSPEAAAAQRSERLDSTEPPEASQLSALPRVHLADLLTRPRSIQAAHTQVTAPQAPRQNARSLTRQEALRTAQLRWQRHLLGFVGLCGVGILLLLAIGIFVLKSTTFTMSPSVANADAAPSAPPAMPTATAADPQPPAPPPVDEHAGELFPQVPSQN